MAFPGRPTLCPGPPTVVVGADLEGLVPAHEEADGPLLLVLQQFDVPGAPLLPLREVVL